MSNINSKVLYLIGSLRNTRIPELAKRIREECPDVEVFDDWFAAGPEADDYWKQYERGRGRTYQEALGGYAARHVFDFDIHHLNRSTHVLLVLPAGKSGHMELMYGAYGVGAETAILLDPEDVRWDVMYQFVPTILDNDEEIKEWLNSPTMTRLSSEREQLNMTAGSLVFGEELYDTSRGHYGVLPKSQLSGQTNTLGTAGKMSKTVTPDIKTPSVDTCSKKRWGRK